MKKDYAPVCLFVYNRYEHTIKTINALKKNKIALDTEIYIFSDAAKNESSIEAVKKIRSFIDEISGFKKISIIKSEVNKGLANSIISGVTDVIERHGRAIVFEDDLISSPTTLEYLNLMLDVYENNQEVMSVTSYSYPNHTIPIPCDFPFDNYFTGRPCSWGWATWKDRWDLVKWEGEIYEDYLNDKSMQKEFMSYSGIDIDRMLKKQLNGNIDSWAVRFVFNCFILKKVASYPIKSYITNIGSDGSGTHNGLNNDFINNNDLTKCLPEKINITFEVDKEILSFFNEFVKKRYYLRRLMFLLKKVFHGS